MSNFLRITSAALLLGGMVAAYYGSLEICEYYFFSDSGPFHYERYSINHLEEREQRE